MSDIPLAPNHHHPIKKPTPKDPRASPLRQPSLLLPPAGSLLAPFVVLAGAALGNGEWAFWLFALLAVIAAVWQLFLPETLGATLPDTWRQANMLVRRGRKGLQPQSPRYFGDVGGF